MKRRWWIVPVTVVLILAATLVAYWDTIVIHVMPNVTLSKAIFNTWNAMEVRLENSPLKVLSGGIDVNGCNTVDLQVDTSNAILGDISYHMNIQMMGNPRKLSGNGTVSTSDGSLNLKLYADRDFAAVSSDNVLDGKYYGITYDTFSEDIRDIPLLPLLIGEKTLRQWEQSVSDLQTQMEKTYSFPNMSKEDIRSAFLGILAVKPQVNRDTLAVNGQNRKVHVLTFSAAGQQIGAAAGNYMQYISPELLEIVKKFANDPASSLVISFFLCDDSVFKMTLDVTLDGESMQAELLLGQNTSSDPVRLAVIRHGATVLDKWSMDVQTAYGGDNYAETWTIVHIENGIQSRNVIDYSWNLSNGDMRLDVTNGAGETPILLNLRPSESGFRLSTEQFETLTGLMFETEKTGNSACVMHVTKGTDVITPDYKNIDRWTGEDMLSLLESLGVLLGLQI